MNIITVSDVHIRGINSKNRVGSYYSDVMSKVEQILKLAKKHKAIILNAGDLFDTDIVSYKIVDDFIDLVEKYKIEWYSVYGNHCQTNSNTQTSESSALNHIFKRCKYFQYLTEVKIENVYIKGYDYKTGIEDDIKQNGLHLPEGRLKDNVSIDIAVIHAMIVEGKTNTLFSSIGTDEINTTYDFVICGHNHSCFEQPPFYNSGCIGRLKINESEFKPHVFLINTDDKSVESIYLKAKPASECFDLTKVNDNNELEGRLNKFVESLGNIKLSELKVSDRVLQFCKSNNVTSDVKEEILRRICV